MIDKFDGGIPGGRKVGAGQCVGLCYIVTAIQVCNQRCPDFDTHILCPENPIPNYHTGRLLGLRYIR